MKIRVEMDMTPDEARQFLGLPNIEKLQEHLISSAEQYMNESDNGQYGEFIRNALQPMLAYQQWLTGMMASSYDESDQTRQEGG